MHDTSLCVQRLFVLPGLIRRHTAFDRLYY